MAHKKGGGSTRNGRDSAGQRLGVKKFGGVKIISYLCTIKDNILTNLKIFDYGTIL